MIEHIDGKLHHLKSYNQSSSEDPLQTKRKVIEDLILSLETARSETVSNVPDPQPDVIAAGEHQCPFSRHPSLASKAVMKDSPDPSTFVICNICRTPLQEMYTQVCRRCLNPDVSLDNPSDRPEASRSRSDSWRSLLCCIGRDSSPPPMQCPNQNY